MKKSEKKTEPITKNHKQAPDNYLNSILTLLDHGWDTRKRYIQKEFKAGGFKRIKFSY